MKANMEATGDTSNLTTKDTIRTTVTKEDTMNVESHKVEDHNIMKTRDTIRTSETSKLTVTREHQRTIKGTVRETMVTEGEDSVETFV